MFVTSKKIHIQKSLALKSIFKCISKSYKSYKSYELYILPNLVHLMSIPITSLQFIFCSVASASLARFSPLSPSLSLCPMPDNNACDDPTTIVVAAHPRSEPLTDCGTSDVAMLVGPTSHLLFLFLLHAWQQHIVYA
jgi:hypothetical protein